MINYELREWTKQEIAEGDAQLILDELSVPRKDANGKRMSAYHRLLWLRDCCPEQWQELREIVKEVMDGR